MFHSYCKKKLTRDPLVFLMQKKKKKISTGWLCILCTDTQQEMKMVQLYNRVHNVAPI
jgi:hypothetical protein